MKHRLYTLLFSCALFLILPASALADGGPVYIKTPVANPPSLDGSHGYIHYRQLGGSESTRFLITASPADGWEFSYWTKTSDGTHIMDNPLVVQMENMNYVDSESGYDYESVYTATFSRKAAPVETFTPAVQACYGHVEITARGSDANCNYTYTLQAVPGSASYKFAQWSDGSKENPRDITLPSKVVQEIYSASFYFFDQCKYETVGTSSEAGFVEWVKTSDCHYTLTATPTAGNHFVKWSDGTTDNPKTIELTDAASDDERVLKAYFQGPDADEIVWAGGASGKESDWDTYSNWKIWKSGETQYTSATAPELKNYNPLSNTLKAIIPSETSSTYVPGGSSITAYPEIPESLSDCGGVHTKDGTKYADNIFIEYGGAIRGVENLTGDENAKLYGSATTQFEAGRKEWILVGTVVKPFNGETSDPDDVRDVLSGDFYLNMTPNVYMREALISGDEISWGNAFPSLNVSVPAQKVFVIQLPDAYGTTHLPASAYYRVKEKDPSKVGDGTVSKTYTFYGRFYNDSELTTYTDLTQGAHNLICNTYPSNLDAMAVQSAGDGTVLLYTQPGAGEAVGSFGVTPVEGSKIKPQQGFVFTPASGTELTITEDMITGGGTKYKSAALEKPSCYLQVINKDSNGGEGSYVALFYDELADAEKANLRFDAPKLFVTTVTVPELYIDKFNTAWAGFNTPDYEEAVPLGLKLRQAMNVEFSLKSLDGYSKAVLTDAETGAQYDLTTEGGVNYSLAAGDYTGRFFLNAEFDETVIDDDLPTDVDANYLKDKITLYAANRNVTALAHGSEQLTEAMVSNVAGKTWTYKLSGNSGSILLPETPGVYVVKVAGTSETKVVKFVVK